MGQKITISLSVELEDHVSEPAEIAERMRSSVEELVLFGVEHDPEFHARGRSRDGPGS